MHKDWCGKPCADCQSPCETDFELTCSPDCENLGKNGEINLSKCKGCDALSAIIASKRRRKL